MKSIPDRPNELVSGGYDSALLHFDVAQGTILSRVDISEYPVALAYYELPARQLM